MSEKVPLLFGRRAGVAFDTSIDNYAFEDGCLDTSGDYRHSHGRSTKKRGGGEDGPKLGTISGCTIPVLQNIIGIVLFLRLPWALGQVGLIAVIVAFVIGQLMSVLTVLSLSALVTNGKTQAGGIYFIVSRTLGPAFGGGMGFLYWGGYTVAVAFYALGLGTLCQQTFLPPCSSFQSETSDSALCSPIDERWTATLIASAVLFVGFIISLCGASSKSAVDKVFFTVQMLSTVYAVASLIVPHTFHAYSTSAAEAFNVTTAFPDMFEENLFPDFTSDKSCPDSHCSFQSVAAILFPMFTGIMQGANLSVDMKNPNRSIPMGTLAAVNSAALTYLVVAIALAGSLPRAALYGDHNILINSAMYSVYPVFIGVAFSAASSTLGNLYGASKVLDAMAQDELLGMLKPFKGRIGRAPRAAVALTWVLAQATVCAGKIDDVAPILTSIFLLAWAVLNLTCAILTSLGTPNFRPRWKYFSKRTAGCGFAISFGIALFLDWRNTLVGIMLLSVLTTYLVLFAPAQDWGSVSRELMFYQIRKYAVQLGGEKQHAKFWRPSILVLAESPTPGLLAFCNKVKKGGLLVIGHVVPGDPIAVHCVVGPLQQGWQHFLHATRIEALTQVAASPTALGGYQLMAGMGSLGMAFNTVVLPMPGRARLEDFPGGVGQYRKAARELLETQTFRRKAGPKTLTLPDIPALTSTEWCECLHDLIAMRKNVLVAANHGSGSEGRNGGLMPDLSDKKFIDVWLPPDTLESDVGGRSRASSRETLSYLVVQLGETLRMAMNHRHGIRIFQVVQSYSLDTVGQQVAVDEASILINEFADACRVIPKQVTVFTLADLKERSATYRQACDERAHKNSVNHDSTGRSDLAKIRKLKKHALARTRNELMKSTTADTMQLFVSLLDLGPGGAKGTTAADEYIHELATMTKGLPPVSLVATGATEAIISDGL